MDDTTSMQFDDDKDEDRAKPHVVDHSEVTRPYVLSVVLEEGAPRLAAGRDWSRLVQVSLNGAFTDLETKFDQFAANAFGTPQPVFLCHLFDEINDFLTDTGFTVLLT